MKSKDVLSHLIIHFGLILTPSHFIQLYISNNLLVFKLRIFFSFWTRVFSFGNWLLGVLFHLYFVLSIILFIESKTELFRVTPSVPIPSSKPKTNLTNAKRLFLFGRLVLLEKNCFTRSTSDETISTLQKEQIFFQSAD